MGLTSKNHSGACPETHESVVELPEEENCRDQEDPFVDHENVIECEKKESICGESHRSNGQEADSYKAGDTPQVSKSIQQQNEGTHALTDDAAKREQVANGQGDEAFHSDEGYDKMQQEMDKIKRYDEFHRANGGYPGLYDCSRTALRKDKLGLDRSKNFLIEYWNSLAEDMRNPQIQHSQQWCDRLHEGTEFRLLIEQLEIAECVDKGRGNDYLKRRPICFTLLEKWHEEEKTQPRAGPSNSKRRKMETEDSCFWFRVEKALRSCKLLNSGGPSDDSQRAILSDFVRYVTDLISRKAVSPDIFLEDSTFMQWWLEYEETLANGITGHSQDATLESFMRNEPRSNYMNSPGVHRPH